MNFYRIFISLLLAFALENHRSYVAAPCSCAAARAGTWFPVQMFACPVLPWARFFRGEGMDIIYLLILAGLYVVSHGLVWALGRLGKAP
jgi:hypothetical protein